jgi:serine/threonine-protein kinase
MGLVFDALYCPEGGFERRVAVKRIHPHLAATPRFVDAFRAEAELSARLTHPCIVQVLDFGRVGESFFLAMEFIDGMTLGMVVHHSADQRRTLEVPIVAHVLRSILEALVFAHEGARGADGRPLRVVHRDLCPPNVLVSRNGEVKLTDFGIARTLADAGQSMTQSVSGHLGYMAPEQAQAGGFDTRADLFPVGAIAWELFTLEPLFRRPTEAASVLALMTGDVLPVTTWRPELDDAWVDFIERAVARDPDARFPSATAMLDALGAIPGARAHEGQEALGKLVRELDEARARGAAAVAGAADATPTLVDERRG